MKTIILIACVLTILLGVGFMEKTDTEEKYTVYWENQRTGDSGHGEPTSRISAYTAAEHGNRTYPFILHWVEETK